MEPRYAQNGIPKMKLQNKRYYDGDRLHGWELAAHMAMMFAIYVGLPVFAIFSFVGIYHTFWHS